MRSDGHRAAAMLKPEIPYMDIESRSQLIKILTTAEPVVLDFEDPKAYQQLIQLFIDDVQPSGSVETALVSNHGIYMLVSKTVTGDQ